MNQEDFQKYKMDEEYGREFGGCLWMTIAIIVGIVTFFTVMLISAL